MYFLRLFALHKTKDNSLVLYTRAYFPQSLRASIVPKVFLGCRLGCRFPQAYAYYTAASCVPIPTPNELYTALCLYLCLPLIPCINFCCLLYLVFSVSHLFLFRTQKTKN